jgi:hypothetical protein
MRPGREADHSPASSAEVKNGGAIPPLLHMSSLRGASLIKHRGFNFLPYLTGDRSQGRRGPNDTIIPSSDRNRILVTSVASHFIGHAIPLNETRTNDTGMEVGDRELF